MSGAPRATMSKRQRELDQKDRAKQRDVRRQERRQRAADRAASGESGPPMGEPTPPITDSFTRSGKKMPDLGVAASRGRITRSLLAEVSAGNETSDQRDSEAFHRRQVSSLPQRCDQCLRVLRDAARRKRLKQRFKILGDRR